MNKPIVNELLEKILVLDTESTGQDPTKVEICEIGFASYQPSLKDFEKNGELLGTIEPIPFEASNLNNISRRMLEGKPKFGDRMPDLQKYVNGYDYVACHNINFDKTILNSNSHRENGDDFFDPTIKFICTFRLAKHLLPVSQNEGISYAQNYLRYRLDLDVPDNLGVHRAADDAYICARLLEHLINYLIDEYFEPEQVENMSARDLGDFLVDFCWSTIEYEFLPFGKKYKGEKISNVAEQDPNYLVWCLDNMDTLQEDNINCDHDLRESILIELEKALKE